MSGGDVRIPIVTGVLFLVALSNITATEPTPDLTLEARVVATNGTTRWGGGIEGTATIELTLSSLRQVRDFELRVLRPDRSAWSVDGRAWSPAPPLWAAADGEVLVGRPDLAAGGAMRAVVEIPLRGAAIHEIVIEAVGTGESGTTATETFVRVPLGVAPRLAVGDGDVAAFELEVLR